jgi:hypothetical protein
LIKQAVLHGEHGGSSSGRDADLEIDVLNVVLDGTPRQHQPLRDLGIGQAAGDQSKYLHLSFGQVGRAATPNRPPAPDGLDHRTHSICIKPSSPCLGLEAINGTRRSDGSAVWAIFDHAAVRVGTSEDAGRHR